MDKSFTLYPAIDLKAGKCVRLLHGEMDQATVYNDDPASQARAFADHGLNWLHIVDLDGAFAGEAANRAAVTSILTATDAKCQLGGGIRSMDAVEGWLSAGLTRVILGTAAVKDPDFVKAAAKAFPDQIAVGIDARGGIVKTDGWASDSGHTTADIARRFEDCGVAALIFTDIGRDGALSGVNVEATAALAQTVTIPVIASGGIAGLEDVRALASHPSGIEGAITGRALYDGRLDPSDALQVLKTLNG
ncbi:MAG: 1-(5-phosphoribosyl)-5-[(5-phosphoribosylamino)methylideneamino]imidazole-4-carboxamide isomerase [Pseudomonadota bacterium]